MINTTSTKSRRATPRSHVFPFTDMRKPVLFEGRAKCMFAGMIVDAAKSLAGRGECMTRAPLEFCNWDRTWRQSFASGNIFIEFFWNEEPIGPCFRGDYYERNPDRIIVSRGAHLGPSDEELMPESQVLATMKWMIAPV